MYAKVGTTAGTAEALRHEARSLDLARSAVPSADVPVVRALETSELGVMLVLDALSGTRFPNRAATDGRHLRFVSELVGHSRTVDGSALRAALVDQLDRAADGPQTHFLRAAMERAEPIWSAIRSVHLAHGDFTPWNCLDRGARLGVVDWEMAGFRVAGWDVLRYPVQIESITRTGDVAGAADRVLAAPLVAEAGEVVTATAEVDMRDGESWPALQAAVLLEGAIELLADQPHLSRRGIAVRAHAAARLLGMAPPAAVS
jgi:hypothetical protein